MLNIIKSDLYRMIHTKSFYITTVVFIGFPYTDNIFTES